MTRDHATEADDAAPAPEAPQRRRRSGFNTVLGGFTWLCLGPAFLLLSAAHLYPQELQENRSIRFAFNCLAFAGEVLQLHIAIACLAAALMALILRRRWLLVASLLLAGIGALPTATTFLPKSPPPAAGETLRVHSMNVYMKNHDAEAILAEIARVDADVLLIQEWHLWHEANLTPSLLERYPNQTRYADDFVDGMAILSKRPFRSATPHGAEPVAGRWGGRVQRVVIDHDGRPLAIYNIHTASPGSRIGFSRNQYQTHDLLGIFSAEPHDFIAGGDFNAPTFSDQIRAIERLGLVDAHDLAGHGPGWTWPNARKPTWKQRAFGSIPGVRIDHIFLSPALTATVSEVGLPHKADHRGTFADVAFRAPAR